jgi:uncharacterized OB-fold protein
MLTVGGAKLDNICLMKLAARGVIFSSTVINSKGSSHLNKEQKPLGSVHIPYMKGV